VTEDVNAQLPRYYAYQRDREQRRQDHVAALVRDAGQQAPDPSARVKAWDHTARAAVTAFDLHEPQMDYAAWKASA
jgi:hypothetical protein